MPLDPPATQPNVILSKAKDLVENPKDMKESHLRSLIKAMSWRILATLTTILIAYFITGQIDIALMIGSIEFVLKFLIYYLHERAWQLVPRGSIRRLVRWDTNHP